MEPRKGDSYEVSISDLSSSRAADIRLKSSASAQSASKIISSSRRSTPNQHKFLGGLRSLLFGDSVQRHAAFRPTHQKVDNGPACRIYGTVAVKKVTANFHITTLGHGYMAHEHTDHASEFARLHGAATLC